VALILRLVIDVTRWVEPLFPLWILVVSIDTLFESLAGRRADGISPASNHP